jgi:Photosynthetic reaction centre cytochrome C subunit
MLVNRRLPALALAASAIVFAVSVAFAQTAPPATAQGPQPSTPQFKNLKVFPQDISREQLISNMKFFAQSLGVRCTFCHLGTEGQPLSTFDFASDAKQEKQTARLMLAMVHRINSQDFGVTDFSQAKVTCFTCHRGSTKPLTQIPAAAAAPPLPAAATPGKPERGA